MRRSSAAGTRTRCPEGTQIIVDGYPSKDGELRANGRDLTFPDGKKLFAGSPARARPTNDLKNEVEPVSRPALAGQGI
jgi:hypothetical protein